MASSQSPVINLALAADQSYLDGLVLALAGAAFAAPGAAFHAYVLDCGIADDQWLRLDNLVSQRLPRMQCTRIPVSGHRLESFAPPVRRLQLNNSTYARCLLAELLPEVDRVIHLDCDLLIDADLSHMFTLDLADHLVGAVPDRNVPLLARTLPDWDLTEHEKRMPAFNAGVMLMDLAALRKSDWIAALAPSIPRLQSVLQSQAVLNCALRNRWLSLPARWNRQFHLNQVFSPHRDKPDSIWHMFGRIKPWHFSPHRAAGIVADCHRLWRKCGWAPINSGHMRLPDGPREKLKAARAYLLRTIHRLSKPAAMP